MASDRDRIHGADEPAGGATLCSMRALPPGGWRAAGWWRAAGRQRKGSWILLVVSTVHIAHCISLYWEGNLRNLSYFLNKRKELEFYNCHPTEDKE